MARPIQPVARSRHRRAISRPDLACGGRQDRPLLLDVRPQILLDEDHAGGARFRGEAECRSEEHTSELQSLMRISYAVFCLKKTTHIHVTLNSTNSHRSYL